MADLEIEAVEKKKQENVELKEKAERLLREIENLRSLEVKTKQRVEEMEKEVEKFKEEKEVLECVSTRAVELEIEIITIQGDLVSSMRGGNERVRENAELKKVLVGESERFEGLEKEVESLRRVRSESEKRVRELERRIGVLEVKEMEEKSKRVRVEEVMREKCNERDGEVKELERRVGDLRIELLKVVGEMEKCRGVKKGLEECLRESKYREVEMVFKKDEVLKKVEEAKERLLMLNERVLEVSKDVVSDGEFKWPVVAAGLIGVVGLVTAKLFVCYLKRT